MYKFTPGKEMEELYRFWLNDMILEVVGINPGEIEEFIFIPGDMFVKLKNGDVCYCCDIDWKKTAKLVKEDNMEKFVVRNWEDMLTKKVWKINGYSNYNCIKSKERKDSYTIRFKGKMFNVYETHIKTAIEILNALGGNFEYKEAEVIDTYEKWEEFQYKLSKENIYYDRSEKEFMCFDDRMNLICEDCSCEHIEQKYNVDLQILKQ